MTRNPVAKAVRTARFRKRVVSSKKTYSRKRKHKGHWE